MLRFAGFGLFESHLIVKDPSMSFRRRAARLPRFTARIARKSRGFARMRNLGAGTSGRSHLPSQRRLYFPRLS